MATAPDTVHQRRVGTLVSADLSGFTAMSERLAELGRRGSEELTRTVNASFTVLIDRAAAEGGDVLKFGGDALLVWFADDERAGCHATRAVRAAAAMQAALEGPRLRRHRLRMSVGIHSGDFDLFLVGTERRELVLCGAPVTTVVGLESRADPGEVLVSDATAQRLPAQWCGRREDSGVVVDLRAVPRRRTSPPGPEHASLEGPDLSGVALDALIGPGLAAQLSALSHTGGEHRMASIGFVELDGTDDLVATSSAATMAARLHAVIDDVQAVAARYGVTFLYTDVISDGVKLLCSAGAPTGSGHDEESILRFASDLVHELHPGRLRAGVHRGRVFAGFLGSDSRRTYTVMGDPVNLAARLLARTRTGQVLASTELLGRSRAGFETTVVTPFLVKGKSEPVSAMLVGRPIGSRTAQEAAPVRMVGREVEVATLSEAVVDALRGVGRVIEVVGEPGMGKTRLLDSVARDPRLPVRYLVECQPYDGLTPYRGVRPLLRAALGIPLAADQWRAGELLAARTTELAPELTGLLPLVAATVDAVVPATAEADAIAPEFRQRRAHEAVLDLLESALDGPALLAIEDAHFIDDASLQLVRELCERAGDRPWLVCVTRRPDAAPAVRDPKRATVLRIGPLDPKATADLAAAAAGSGTALRDLELAALVERAGGNPLFVLELVRAGHAGSLEELPESIERLVAMRIDRIDPAARMVLRQAAVLGPTVDLALLDAVRESEGAGPVGGDVLVELTDLLEPCSPGSLRFRHATFRDVAYEGLPFARRQHLHRTVGHLLEDGVAGSPDPALLSVHFWHAGDAARTWRYSVAAGDAAWARHAVVEAIGAYGRALSLSRRLQRLDPFEIGLVSERLADAYERAARYDEALAAYRSARRRLGAESPASARLARKTADVHQRSGRYDAALRWYQRGLARCDHLARAGATRAELLLGMAATEERRGRVAEALELAMQARALARRARDRRLEAQALSLLQALSSYEPGGLGRTHGQRALRLLDKVGDVHLQGKVLNNLGVEAYFRGDWAGATESYAQAADRFDRAGDAVEGATARNNLGEIRADQGHWAEAAELFERARTCWQASGFRIGIGVSTSNLGRLAARRGDHDDADRLLGEALETFAAIGARVYVVDVRARYLEALALRGCAPEILERAMPAELHDLADVGGASRSLALRSVAWAQAELGDPTSALVTVRDALDVARTDGNPFEVALTLRMDHAISRAAGLDGGDRLLDEAQRVLDGLGVVRLAEPASPPSPATVSAPVIAPAPASTLR
jgi:class 3 adenylate cyclase/tetratricopeptide (TPR) repeat protein